MPPLQHWNTILLIIVLRYFILAGLAWLVWYVWLRKKLLFKKIQYKLPQRKDYLREIGYSLITMLIFSAVPIVLLRPPIKEYTLFYTDVNQYPKLWFWLAFPIMLLLHDAYFYITHRLMHHPFLFKWFHLVHHKSVNPSPWAAFAFHPLEALVEAGIIAVFVFCIPITSYHLFFFFLFMMVYNVYGHLGWELYPKGFNKSLIGKWINTSINHNQHHQYFKGNYGLYFLWWDKWFDTLRPDYDEKFAEITSRKSGTKT
jgi:Delta7-sterol 5-desaturase